MNRRVIVTASRTWPAPSRIRRVLDWELAAAQLAVGMRLVVVHGAHPKADAPAAGWARHHRWDTTLTTVVEDPFKASWSVFGRRAGMVRNAAMVKAGADRCYAFIGPCDQPDCSERGQHGSHGATNCADLAQQAGIETIRFKEGFPMVTVDDQIPVSGLAPDVRIWMGGSRLWGTVVEVRREGGDVQVTVVYDDGDVGTFVRQHDFTVRIMREEDGDVAGG